MEDLFFDSVDNLWRVAISAPVLYITVIAYIRLSGKRSTSQMNNFDWIVTVAIGSLVGSGIILKDVALTEALLAIGLLLAMQYVVTKAVVHSERIAALVKASPRLLVYEGELLEKALLQERISEKEVLAAVREHGLQSLAEVRAMVLETDASLSVLSRNTTGQHRAEAYNEVTGWPK
ncbi:YetF domain-containing protein [Alcanivorax sp.]|jgi:uncharacterized membrane protein YcaP (DUF421 family)|uniref:DUF421 domain-containing protein n=1 Tax=Alcanivorax sp. TaxID=1872427 RepID=UPI0032D8CCAC